MRGLVPRWGRVGAWQNPPCQFAEPTHNSNFSYLGVQAQAGMSDWYENEGSRHPLSSFLPPTIVIPATHFLFPATHFLFPATHYRHSGPPLSSFPPPTIVTPVPHFVFPVSPFVFPAKAGIQEGMRERLLPKCVQTCDLLANDQRMDLPQSLHR